MFDKWRQARAKGIFKYYFIGNFIKDKQDYDCFTSFYEDRIAAIAASYLLGLEPKVSTGKFEVSANGKTAAITFLIGPNNPNNSDAFDQDIDSLIKYQNFLVDYANNYFFDGKRKFSEFSEVVYYVFNSLGPGKKFDTYSHKNAEIMINDCKTDILSDRAKVRQYDQDLVLASADISIRKLDMYSDSSVKSLRIDEIAKILRSSLGYQLQLQNDELIKERQFASQTPHSASRQKCFWQYLLQAKRIQENPQMW